MHSPCVKEATQLCLQGCYPTPILRVSEPEQPIAKTTSTSAACRRNFAVTTASSFFPNTHFTNHESIPSLQESFIQFIKAYPKYSDTAPVDRLRAREYGELSLSNHVCLDYIGVGLFSQSQVNSKNASDTTSEFPLFGITFKSVSLKSQLLHGGEGSELESAIKNRIMDFLNISQNDYCMVFTANKSSAFKLVAESYPFRSSRKLLTVYDHESEAVDSMISMSEKRGARVMAAEFKWPRLRINSVKLRKMIVRKKKKKKHRGLFVFPLQSRMTGASYSYQWMTMGEEHGWHVLLDACALGPKDMDSFGLSLFRPDFLVCSFYKVFGENPTGFGCLFVKKSIVPILEDATGAGIVSITPAKNLLLPEDSSGTDAELEQIARLGIKQECDNISKSIVPYTEQDSKDRKSEENETSDVCEKQSCPTENRSEYPEQVELKEHIVPLQERHLLKENEGSIIQCRCLDHVDSLGLMLVNSRGREKQRMLETNIKENEAARSKSRKADQGIAVVTVALTFLANFEDVYRLWAFIAQFLDADFVEKERWRYTALNQKTIEVHIIEHLIRDKESPSCKLCLHMEFVGEANDNKDKSSSSGSLQLWSQWQLLDSILPTGGFAHSFGLEAAMQARLVISPEDLRTYVIRVLENTGSLLLPFVYAAAMSPDTQTWHKLDRLLNAMLTNEVGRKGSIAQGSGTYESSCFSFLRNSLAQNDEK
ncbi:Urease accessory protein F [Sesamum angolense]|uniref:Urease accessory protein F n=1 Tax=Sesamum angolense TaxID=2727404 RepID=A0AAE1W1K4_9LAMI|nr:Urease accessory protein F [Sesamum angolense]